MARSSLSRSNSVECEALLLEDFPDYAEKDEGPGTDAVDLSCQQLWSNGSTPIFRTRKNLPEVTLAFARHILFATWDAAKPTWAASRGEPKRIYPTSWLDGVRGLAALFVVFHHTSYVWLNDFRLHIELDFPHILNIPMISIVVAGTGMVNTFFVISGFCVSHKTLQNARIKGNEVKIFTDLSSSTFRRALRLYLPCLFITFTASVLAYTGYYHKVPVRNTFPEQTYAWLEDFIWGMSPFDITTYITAFAFEENIWTIPMEFRGSLHVFVCLLALSRAHNAVRLWALVGLEVYLSLTGRWGVLLFNSGMLCCDLRLIQIGYQQRHFDLSKPAVQHGRRHGCWKLFLDIIRWTCFAFTIFLLSTPEYDTNFGPLEPYYRNLRWRPQSWQKADGGPQATCAARPIVVYSAAAAILQIDLFVPELKKWVFERRFPQYLGRISFMMYLVHGLLLRIWGDYFFWYPWAMVERMANPPPPIDGNTEGQTVDGEQPPAMDIQTLRNLRMLTYLVCMAFFFLPVLFWVSDLVTKSVDRGCVKFAKWLEGKCFRS